MRRFWTIAGLVLVLLLLLFLMVEALGIPLLADPTPWLRRGGPLAALLGVGLLCLDFVLPVPSSLVMVANGALFGTLVGTLLSLLGSVGGAMLGFGAGRHGGRLMARLVPPEERARADRLLQRWGALAIIATRPLPLLADTVAILAGASTLGWRRVALAAALGSLPPALLYALAGATAAAYSNTVLMFALIALLAGLFWLGGRWVQARLPNHGHAGSTRGAGRSPEADD